MGLDLGSAAGKACVPITKDSPSSGASSTPAWASPAPVLWPVPQPVQLQWAYSESVQQLLLRAGSSPQASCSNLRVAVGRQWPPQSSKS